MSGGHFDYQQYRIGEIANSVHESIKKALQPRPRKVKKHGISVKKKISEGRYTTPYGYYSDRHYESINSRKDAEAYLRRLRNVKEIDGRFFDTHEEWTDKDGKFHPVEYVIEEWTYMDYPDGRLYLELTDETIREFKKAEKFLRIAEVYAQRIDWLLSGDDGEETFHERLKEDLQTIKDKTKACTYKWTKEDQKRFEEGDTYYGR